MLIAWMGYAVLSAAVFALAGACAESMLGNRVRRKRILWSAVMAASVIVPIAAPLVLPLVLPLVASRQVDVVDRVTVVSGATAIGNDAQRTPLLSPESTRLSLAPLLKILDWNSFATVAWLVVSCMILVVLALEYRRLVRRVRRCTSINVNGRELLVSSGFGPAVVGFMRTVIVLPTWVLELSDRERELVVSHEVEHQSARDSQLAVAGLLLVVLFPWNAALWWQLSRLRLAIELDCDARVVAHCKADPFAYGNLLVAAYEHATHASIPMLALAPLRSALGARVNALVVRTGHTWRRSATAFGVGATALSVLAFTPTPDFPKLSFAERGGASTAGGRVERHHVETAALRRTTTIANGPASTLPVKSQVRSQALSPTVSQPSSQPAVQPTMRRTTQRASNGMLTMRPNVESNAATTQSTTTSSGSMPPLLQAAGDQQQGGTYTLKQLPDTIRRGGFGGVVRRTNDIQLSVQPSGQSRMVRAGGQGGSAMSSSAQSPVPQIPEAAINRAGFMGAEVRGDTIRPSIR